MKLLRYIVAAFLALGATDAYAQVPAGGVSIGTPIGNGSSCLSGYTLTYTALGQVGCAAAGAATLSIGSAITGATNGYGLYVGTGGQAGQLQQFAYGSNIFTALGSALNGTGAISATTSPLFTTPGITGSSTGNTTFSSANAGATNYTITFPAITDTLVTLTATQTLTNKTLTAPTLTSPTVTGAFTATGLVTNADLANSATTVNGTTCTLGSTCTPSASAVTTTIGTGATLSGNSQIYVCTGTCSITLPTPSAGVQYCVMNDTAVTTVITVTPGTGVQVTNTSYAYKASATAIASGGAAGDQMCFLGRDSTHYLLGSYTGTWS